MIYIKLINGQDIIAELVDDSHQITIRNPIALMANGEKIIPINWIPFSKKNEVTLSKDNVLFATEPTDEMAEHHREIFGGIVTPNKKIIY